MAEAALGRDATYAALHDGVVARRVARDVVIVAGPDARSFLQGQCTQDLAGLAPGAAVSSLVLSPQGKVDAYVRIAARADEAFLLEVDAGYGEALTARLARFKIRVRATLELAQWSLVELRGPHAAAAVEREATGEVLVLPVTHPGLTGVDLFGPRCTVPAAVPTGDDAGFEAARIEAGLAVMGRELTAATIPQEAGIVESTVSFTKGCFTGQELVARLDARGSRVARRLRGVVAPPQGDGPAPGDILVEAGRELGTVTSAAYSPRTASVVALAYLRREVEPPATLGVERAGVALGLVEVLELPLVS